MRSVSFGIGVAVIAVCLGLVESSAQSTGIPSGATIFVDKIDADLDADIRAELARQKVALTLVTSASDAQLLLVSSQATDVNMAKEQRGLLVSIRRSGTLTVQDRANGATLWSEPWQVNSYNPKEQRKVASQLVGKLKKAIRSKPK